MEILKGIPVSKGLCIGKAFLLGSKGIPDDFNLTEWIDISHPVVVVAHELQPFQMEVLDPHLVNALVTEVGDPTNRTANLANANGIPAVVGLQTIKTDCFICTGTFNPFFQDKGNCLQRTSLTSFRKKGNQRFRFTPKFHL